VRLAQQANRMMRAESNLLPVLLCAPELRRHLRSLSERSVPHLRVLSMAEIPRVPTRAAIKSTRNSSICKSNPLSSVALTDGVICPSSSREIDSFFHVSVH
jgi:hypothetical protein